MERRSKMLLATALGATIVVVACSFPEVTYRSDDGDAGSESDTGTPTEDTGTDTGTDAEPGVEDSGGSDSEPPPLIEAGLPTEGGVVEDASACEGEDAGLRRCDCDEDGWMIKGCDAGPNSGLKGGGTQWDCDDHNRDVNPESDYKAVSLPDGTWDWNCDGKVTKAYQDGYSCTLACKSKSKNGFEIDRPCGSRGALHVCDPSGLLDLSCTDNVQKVDEVQGCR